MSDFRETLVSTYDPTVSTKTSAGGEFTEYDPNYDPLTGSFADFWTAIGIDPKTISYGTGTASDPKKFLEANASIYDLIKAVATGNSSLGAAGSIASALGVAALANKLLGGSGGSGFAGYKGSIPEYTATREVKAIPTTVPNPRAGLSGEPATIPRRPGSGGIEYFSPMVYTKVPAASDTVKGGSGNDTITGGSGSSATTGGSGSSATTGGTGGDPTGERGASGGIVSQLGSYSDGGQLLRGPGDGVSDSIPARIGRQPARLADGEFVIPARIVSELGNGSTEAGARKLYDMMERIKRERKKAKTIAADTKADRFLPR